MLDIFKTFTMKKKVLITGGSGFIASHLADKLTENGYQVIIFDKKKLNFLIKKISYLLEI